MKNLFATLLTMMSVDSFAAYNGSLLDKIYQTGFVPPDRAFALECKIFSEKVMVKYRKTGLTKTIELQKQIDPHILTLIDKAATGQITSIQAPTDIGLRIYTATQILENDSIKTIDLGSTRDSVSITNNLSPEAAKLKSYLDEVCDAAMKM